MGCVVVVGVGVGVVAVHDVVGRAQETVDSLKNIIPFRILMVYEHRRFETRGLTKMAVRW